MNNKNAEWQREFYLTHDKYRMQGQGTDCYKVVKSLTRILQIQLYRVRDIAFKQNFYERLCRVGSIHLCSTDAMTPEIDIRRIKNPRDVKEVLSKTIEACRKANGIRTSEIIGDHGRFPEPDPHGMPPEPCHEHPHD